ncbi:MAG: FecCD family ABC transporter permease [Prochloraceae cyanobacterium]
MSKLSFNISRKQRLGLTILLLSIGLILIGIISLSLGAVDLTISELWQGILQRGDRIDRTIIWQLRLPRILAAMLVGAALGTSGALLQGMLRNPLATPFLLGISAGAGLVIVSAITLGLYSGWIPLAAWCGAIFTTTLVYFLARNSNNIAIDRLILAGVAISSLFGSLQTVLLLLAEDSRIQTALNWIVGSLNGRGWQELSVSAPYILVALIVACLLGRNLNVLNLGDDLAVGLGFKLGRSRILIGGVATLLAAGAVSIAGLIGFVGLIVPQAIRLSIGSSDYRWLIPLSALGGALVLSGADLLARIGAVELPVGAVTALLGSPLFVWLLYRRK